MGSLWWLLNVCHPVCCMASKKVLFDVVPVSKRDDSLPFWRFAVGVILVSDRWCWETRFSFTDFSGVWRVQIVSEFPSDNSRPDLPMNACCCEIVATQAPVYDCKFSLKISQKNFPGSKAIYFICFRLVPAKSLQSIILRNYNFTAYLNMIIKFQVI